MSYAVGTALKRKEMREREKERKEGRKEGRKGESVLIAGYNINLRHPDI